MNQKFKLLFYIAGFVLFILAAVAGYNYLSKNYKAPGSNDVSEPSKTDSEALGSSSPTPETVVTPTGTPPDTESETPGNEGEAEDKIKAPDFTVLDYDGNEVTLHDYIGTPIVLNFWASWCPPCRDEMPHFNKVSEEYQKDELLFLMVDLAEGRRETVEAGKKFVEDNGFTFTVLFDTQQDAAITYGVRTIPSTLFIDKDGYILGGIVGGIDEETLRYYISFIIDE